MRTRASIQLQLIVCCACFDALPLSISASSLELGRLRGTNISTAEVSIVLAQASRLSAAEGSAVAAEIAALNPSAVEMPALVLTLGAVQERAGDLAAARESFRGLARGWHDPYSVSAIFRQQVLKAAGANESERTAMLRALARKPEAAGWFVISNQWVWSTSRAAAWQGLVELRSSRLSFKAFEFGWAKVGFAGPYAYLLVLLGLALGAKILQLPLLVQAARTALKVRSLQPQVQAIQSAFGHDQVLLHRRIGELYTDHGVSPTGGCLVLLADLIFVVWVLVGLGDFAPRLAMEGARLFWIGDVTQFHIAAVVLWWTVTFVLSASPQARQSSLAGVLFGSLFLAGIIGFAAWHWQWPAYVFVFWSLLSVLSGILNRALVSMLSGASSK